MMQAAQNTKQKAAKLKQTLPKLRDWCWVIAQIRLAMRRYFAWKHSWKTSSAGLVVIFVAVLLGWNMLHTSAVTYVLVPNGDVTSGWSPTPAGSHYTTVDDGITDNTADYVQVLSTNATASVTDQYNLNSPTDSVASASKIVLRIYMEALTASNGGTMDTISLSLIVNGVAQTATTCTPTNGTWTACTATYSGSWTQSDVDSMQVKIVRNILGSGKTSSQPDTVVVSNVYGTLTYVANIQYNQSAYRWFANTDAATGPVLNFATKVDYATSTNPQSVTTADFNGDGLPDLAVANYSSGTVSVLLNNGDGTFAAKVDYTTALNPKSVFAADFNGDGTPDLAVAASNATGLVSVLLNNGDGTFAAKVDYTTGANAYSVTAADFNGDGKIDLATANNSANSVSILMNNGTGTFAAKVDYTTGTGPYAITAADFNGDGKPDLAIANYGNNAGNTFSILMNNGTGTFAAKVDYTTGTSPQSVIAADFNGDGKPDLALGNGTSAVSVHLNNGDGTFAANTSYTTGSLPYSVTAADFNGDGKIDLATANNSANSVSILMNNGTGTFAAKVDYTTGTGPYAITAADFNGDGKPDLAIANQNANTSSVLMNTTSPSINVGASLAAAQDTAATAPAEGTIFRLRVDLHVSGGQLNAGVGRFQLKYALRGAAASCSAVASTSYNLVSDTSNGIRWADNTNAVNGMGLVTNGSDPKHGTDPNINQAYREKGTTSFSNTSALSIGQDGMWDFGLVAYQSIGGDDYCFKVVRGDGSDLNTYTVYPEIVIPAASFTQASYRWYNPNPAGAALTFVKAYGGTGTDIAHEVVNTTDGGYAVTGDTYSYGAGADDMFLSKYDKSGNLTWTKTWGGTGTDRGYSLVQTTDGGYAVGGYTESFGAGGADVFIAKYDSTGTLSWSRTWGGTAYDYGAQTIIQTSDGGYALTGQTTSYGAGAGDMFLVKYDSTGTLSWSKTWGGTGSDYGYSLVQTSDGGYAVTGQTSSFNDTTNGDMFIAKYDSTGTLSWSRTWGGTSSDIGYSLVQTSDGGYAVTGSTSSYGAGGADMFLVKYDSTGTLSWSKTWGGTGSDYGYSLVQTSDGGYAVGGYEISYGAGNADAFIAKYDSSGGLSWNKTWGGANSDYGYSLVQTSDGGYALSGYSGSYGSGSSTAFIAKYDSSGGINNCNSTMCQSPTATVGSPGVTSFTPSPTAGSPTPTTSTPSATVSSVTPITTVVVANAQPIGSPLAPQNSPLDLASLTPMNLRIAVRVDNSGINTSGQSFKLQYALLGGALTCSAVATANYADITTTSPLAYYDDSAHASGDAINTNVNDPSDGSRTMVAQAFEESNNFTNNVSALYAGQDGMWQFSLVINASTLRGKDFCVRVATSGGTQLTATNIPEMAYAPQMVQLMKSGKWFNRQGVRQNLIL